MLVSVVFVLSLLFKSFYFLTTALMCRFSKEVNTVHQLQVSLIDDVLVMLLWHDYLSLASSKNQVRCLSEDSNGPLEVDVQPSVEGQIETLNKKYPQTYIHDLAKCIIEILSDISMKECGLLSAFGTSFQKDCLDILHRADTSQKSSGYTEEIVNFLFLVEKHSVQKGESWPLVYLAQPMLETFFPLIKSMVSEILLIFLVPSEYCLQILLYYYFILHFPITIEL